MKETNLVQKIRLETAKDAILWRNNQGAFEDKNGRWIKFGVCNPGGSDLIGFRKSDGKFIGIEVKVPGKKPTPEQLKFIAAVRKSGGLAGVAYSVEDALKIISG